MASDLREAADGEFAEEYTRAEKLRYFIFYGSLILIPFIVGKIWISPWFKWFVKTGQCHRIYGLHGFEVLMFGLFVGLPCFAMLACLHFSREGYKIFRDKQWPAKNTKVFKPTKIVHGKKALAIGIAGLILPTLPLVLAIWGYGAAEKLTKDVNRMKWDMSVCQPGASIHWGASTHPLPAQ
jgi:hypothetical protein